MTKRIIHSLLFCLVAALCQAQDVKRPFQAYLTNSEFHVYLRINFYEQDVEVPSHELYGLLPGFLGKEHNTFCWPVTSCRIKDDQHATLQMINDFGSEDLEATLTCQDDSVYVLRQTSGNTLKVPNGNKWQKLPKTLYFKRR